MPIVPVQVPASLPKPSPGMQQKLRPNTTSVSATGKGNIDQAQFSAAASHVNRLANVEGETGPRTVPFRTTEVKEPRAVFVFLAGTMGKPEYMDGLGEQLAQSGIKTYALAPRSDLTNYKDAGKELEAVVALARAENPRVRVTVGGVSAGANLMLAWRDRYGKDTPTVAMSPVVVPKFLGPLDLAKVAAGLLGGPAAKLKVETPMSRYVPLTTNPKSPESKLKHAWQMRIPAAFFDQVILAAGDSTVHRKATGPVYVPVAGKDGVAFTSPSKWLASLLPGKSTTVETFPELAHDLSQEWQNPAFMSHLTQQILGN